MKWNEEALLPVSEAVDRMIRGSLRIEPPEEKVRRQVQRSWDNVAKPLDSLGKFEEIFAQIGAVQGRKDPALTPCELLVFCADNGIVEEGISQSDQSVTAQCAESIGRGKSCTGIMAAKAGVRIRSIDIGIAEPEGKGDGVPAGLNDFSPGTPDSSLAAPATENYNVRHGTRNFLKEPAMTCAEMRQALQTGMELVRDARQRGVRLLAAGEMGIGNTTTSACMAAALLPLRGEETAGRGAGLDDERLRRKIQVINRALEKYHFKGASESTSEDTGDRTAGPASGRGNETVSKRIEAFRVLQCVGGLDIAAMTGVYLGGALYHVPVVLDGVISLVAALTAERILPGTKQFLIPSHVSREPAAEIILRDLDFHPVLDADMALGEGSGAVMMIHLLNMVECVYRESNSFSDIRVEPYERFSDR